MRLFGRHLKFSAITTTIPKGKVKRVRGSPGRRNHIKKACVILEEGNTIDVITSL